MNDHVGKPFKRPELYAAIDRWVERERCRRRDEADPDTVYREQEPNAEAILDAEAFASIKDRMGVERIQSLLMLLEAELRARFDAMDEGSPETIDRTQLAHDSHAMISAAGILGFAGLSALCREVEAACNSGSDLGPLIHRLGVLRGGTIRTIQALRAA